jgi:hypothetical protein
MDDYRKLRTQREKNQLAQSIVGTIQAEGGRFMRKNENSGQWEELSATQANEKVCFALRDFDKYNSSKSVKDPTAKRKDPPSAAHPPIPASGGSGDSFLAHIDETLGPLPEDAKDPLEGFIKK